jgi:hypothetical protein
MEIQEISNKNKYLPGPRENDKNTPGKKGKKRVDTAVIFR